MIERVGKYTDVGAVARAAAPTPFYIARRRRRPVRQSMLDFLHAEARPGGLLDRQWQLRRFLTDRRWRQVARERAHERPNPRSDFKLLARIPAAEFHNWRAVDRDFWKDDNNLRSLRRDNDDLRACIHV